MDGHTTNTEPAAADSSDTKKSRGLSVVIIALDEERTIGQVLNAAKNVADEIIVVDSGSKDRTREIAETLGARVFHQDWLGYAAQKNYAISLASHDWILSLDADEVMTPELVAEIKRLLKSPHLTDCAGYKIPRLLFIGEVAIRHGGFYPDAQLRLFARELGCFNDRMVHEAVQVKGASGRLSYPMHHLAYQDAAEFAAAMEKYAGLSAQEFARRGVSGWRTSRLNELVHPWWTLFYRYLLRAGFLDGQLGWKLSWIYSDYVRRKIRYLRALTGAKC